MNPTYIKNVANPLYARKQNNVIQYGTAGFRSTADQLEHVVYRMGLLCVLRSKVCGETIGLMITASHNAEPDNGVKLIDPNGEMLETSWEEIATDLANVDDTNLVTTIQNIINTKSINMNARATVITGRDTRKSSPSLLKAALDGIKALNGEVTDFGIITTPQLHYIVVCINTNGSYGDPSLKGYCTKLSTAFKHVKGTSINNGKYVAELYLDAANGVGALACKNLKNYLGDALKINIYNDGSGPLNYMCGADYVKTHQKPPLNCPLQPNIRCVSLDGDADRIIYFYKDDLKQFHMLDGDRMATLIASYIKELLEKSSLPLQLGLVQTAYSNGGSTDYISNSLKIPVTCVETGIKHLHHKAKEYDIGVYFEANGHGTVIFKDAAMQTILSSQQDHKLPEIQRNAASKLIHIIDIINQTVGDALSDMLLIETILYVKGWDIAKWGECYRDLPNKQVKIKVKDKNVITTMDAGRKCTTPIGLQDEIDKVVLKYRKGRSFVRPSGTEDIVRIYSECEDSVEVNSLAAEISLLVYNLAGGVGPKPTL